MQTLLKIVPVAVLFATLIAGTAQAGPRWVFDGASGNETVQVARYTLWGPYVGPVVTSPRG